MDSKPDIIQVIGRYVELKQKGREYVAICPFHDDTKPSMTVEPNRQFYKCFACGAGGDVFSFVMDMHKCSFLDAKRRIEGGLASDGNPVKRVAARPLVDMKIDPAKAREIASDNYTRARLEPPGLAWLARELGVSMKALYDLKVGKHDDGCWSAPMYDHADQTIGIRIRADDGSKWSIDGSRGGLFMPQPFPTHIYGPLLICEGFTDTAAALTLGYVAIGRQNNNSGNEIVQALVKRLLVTEIWIVPDPDEEGVKGAAKLADELVDTKKIKLVLPTRRRDLRRAVCEGVQRDGFECWARNTNYHRKSA